jgi:hypothetical protein
VTTLSGYGRSAGRPTREIQDPVSRRTSRRAEAVPPPERLVREADYAEERSTQGALALWVWLEDFRQVAVLKPSHREFKHEHQVELSESAVYPMGRSTVSYSGCQVVLPHAVAEAVIDEGVRGQKWSGPERQSNIVLRAQLQARGNLP